MSAHRVNRPATAFGLSGLRQRRPRRQDQQHLAWIRTLPSVVPGRDPVEAAHIRYADARYAKESAGLQQKPDDAWVVPLAADQHRAQHARREQDFWASHGIDPIVIAAFLYVHSGDDVAGAQIIRNAKLISSRRSI